LTDHKDLKEVFLLVSAIKYLRIDPIKARQARIWIAKKFPKNRGTKFIGAKLSQRKVSCSSKSPMYLVK